MRLHLIYVFFVLFAAPANSQEHVEALPPFVVEEPAIGSTDAQVPDQTQDSISGVAERLDDEPTKDGPPDIVKNLPTDTFIEAPVVVVAPRSSFCSIAAPEGSSELERLVWGDICNTGYSNPSLYGPDACALDEPDIHDLIDHPLSEKFLTTILSSPNYIAARATPDVRLECAYIPSLKLSGRHISGSLSIEDSVIESIDLTYTRIEGTLDLRYSRITERAFAAGLELRRNLVAYYTQFDDGLSLNAAQIGGYLDLENATVIGGFSANDAQVSRSVYLEGKDGSFDGVKFYHAEIGKNLIIAEAKFTGPFQFQDTRVGEHVFIKDGASFENFDWHDANIGGNLEIRASSISEGPNLPDALIGANLHISDGAALKDVNLHNGDILGSIYVNDTVVEGEYDAGGLSVGGNIFLGSGAQFQDLVFLRARIGGSLNLKGATVLVHFNGNGLVAQGDVNFYDDAALQTVSLIGAKIGGSLAAVGSTFSGDLDMQAIHAQDSAFLREGSNFHRISLVGAEIGKQLQLQGSSYNGEVDLSEADIGSLLLWRGGSDERSVGAKDANWGAEASLILRNARTNSLQARMGRSRADDDSWTRQDGTRLPTDLVGFRYDLLGGFTSGAEYDLAQIDTPALINWVDMSMQNGAKGYSPQPYRSLENALLNQGAEAAARQVAYARLIHRADMRVTAVWTDEPVRWFGQVLTLGWDRFLQFTIGFGVYPAWAFYWFFLLVGVGVFLARPCPLLCREGQKRANWGDSFFYSLENAIPLMEPSADYAAVKHDNPRIRLFFNAQKVLGFVIASVLIGGLTLGP